MLTTRKMFKVISSSNALTATSVFATPCCLIKPHRFCVLKMFNCFSSNFRVDHSKQKHFNSQKSEEDETMDCNNRNCTTYATADHYRFANLVSNVSMNGRFQCVNLPIDVAGAALFYTSDQTVTRNNDNGYVVFFKDGAISFWNISDKVTSQFLEMAALHEEESYKRKMVQWEKEQMEYKYVVTKTRLFKNSFELSSDSSHERMCCEIFAFSNALVASVKLAHWEQSLDLLIQSIETFPRDLMKGKYLRSYTSEAVLSKIGEVLMIRHRLNLKYHMLDVPDVYWDEEDLENLYVKTTEFLNIQRRVKVMNEKLTYCAHVVELVKSHMAEQKSIRIEILIVLLILIEVLFEVVHFYVKPYLDKKRGK